MRIVVVLTLKVSPIGIVYKVVGGLNELTHIKYFE